MKIKYLAYIRDYTGVKEEVVENCETVTELINKLCAKYGETFAVNIFKGDKLSNKIIILVNGRNISNTQGINTKLSENDEISILPILAGG